MNADQRKKYGYKLETECTPEEVTLINKWFEGAHPSNHPKSRAKALWSFRTTNGKTTCGLHAGFI